MVEAFRSPDTSRQTAEPVSDLSVAQTWITQATSGWATGQWFSWAVTDADGVVLTNATTSSIDRRHEEG